MTKTILVDMDHVLADWEPLFWERLHARIDVPGWYRSDDTYDLFGGTSPELREAVLAVMNEPRFFADFEPIPGCAEALNEMLDEGHQVAIATAPWPDNPTCASDKLWWARHHIGPGWENRTIITRDKTFLTGDILIDDKPAIKGNLTPTWEHVWFTAPHNVRLTGRRRISDWKNWREIVETELIAA